MVQVRKAVFGEGERGSGSLDLAAVLSVAWVTVLCQRWGWGCVREIQIENNASEYWMVGKS